MNIKKVCKICVLPESEGHIEIGEDGVCSVCKKTLQAQKESKSIGIEALDAEKRLQLLINKIEKRRGKSKYDCAVAVSGGKDSIMTLYIAKKILNVNPLAIFLDNGFSIPEMYHNINNAVDRLGIDLVIIKTTEMKEIFSLMLNSKKKIYYCRLCHLLLDEVIKSTCSKYDISLLLGGYTKGQSYISQDELFWIYKESDMNCVEILKNSEKYKNYAEIFVNPIGYFAKKYRNIESISPYKYMEYNEDEIVRTIKEELNFKLPEHSWPKGSTNCLFNYLAQHMANKQFGYSQHETELSGLIRSGEMKRKRAIEILETPITQTDLDFVLEKLNLNKEVIL